MIDGEIWTTVIGLARELGVAVDAVVPLRSTNNDVAWLRPSRVVAKLSRSLSDAAEEVRVASLLAEVGAPAVAPVIDRALAIAEGSVSLWRYEPQDGVAEPRAAALGEALFALHDGLSRIALMRDLGRFDAELDTSLAALERPGFAPELDYQDRLVLHDVLSDGVTALPTFGDSDLVIHGPPHRFNVVVVDNQPRFIDFETVTRGPVEWDLAHLPPAVATNYPGDVNDETLAVCRVLVSAKTAAWCWHGIDRGPDMRHHAEHHLAVVRAAAKRRPRRR
jgi:Phosphotransferase enzyme family